MEAFTPLDSSFSSDRFYDHNNSRKFLNRWEFYLTNHGGLTCWDAAALGLDWQGASQGDCQRAGQKARTTMRVRGFHNRKCQALAVVGSCAWPSGSRDGLGTAPAPLPALWSLGVCRHRMASDREVPGFSTNNNYHAVTCCHPLHTSPMPSAPSTIPSSPATDYGRYGSRNRVTSPESPGQAALPREWKGVTCLP